MRYIYGVSPILRIGLLWAKTTDGWNKLFSNLVPRFSPLYLAREAKKREKSVIPRNSTGTSHYDAMLLLLLIQMRLTRKFQ